MIFNKNHLGHLLFVRNDHIALNNDSWIDCICKKCKAYICFDKINENYVSNIENIAFFDDLKLTCDEIIIKNLLE